MISELEKLAVIHGDRLTVIPIKRMFELENLLETYKQQADLNSFQQWIMNDLYQFELPEVEFSIKSIILVAIHHPFYAKIKFQKNAKEYNCLSLVNADFEENNNYIIDHMESSGFSLKVADNPPLKRLGVHSGLAKYGRNNITYIDGLGSNFSYTAYFSDLPCEEDNWGEVMNADLCKTCTLCINSCPTGAIRKEQFLIDNQKCLSCINEVPGDFPDWLPMTVHHTLYDCLICQKVCPMNNKQKDDVLDNISFSEEETNLLLYGAPISSFSDEMRKKVLLLGIDRWYDAIPRNLDTLFKLQEHISD